jgi:hypothetical protein
MVPYVHRKDLIKVTDLFIQLQSYSITVILGNPNSRSSKQPLYRAKEVFAALLASKLCSVYTTKQPRIAIRKKKCRALTTVRSTMQVNPLFVELYQARCYLFYRSWMFVLCDI